MRLFLIGMAVLYLIGASLAKSFVVQSDVCPDSPDYSRDFSDAGLKTGAETADQNPWRQNFENQTILVDRRAGSEFVRFGLTASDIDPFILESDPCER